MKLDKKQQKEHSEVGDALRAKWDALEKAIETFNADMAAAFDARVAPARDELEEAITAAKEFAETIASDAESGYDEKSEKWQESDKGCAVYALVESWQNVDLPDGVDLAAPEPLEVPDVDLDGFDGLPQEPE